MADISKITLPSGTTYDIKDSVAREMISAGITFIIAWDGTNTPVAANIPKNVVVSYTQNNTTTSITGTLETTDATAGAFYLIKSSTTPSSEALDIYDEYAVIKPDKNDDTTWHWEKIGDTKLNLTNIVKEVTLNKDSTSAIGINSTFTITQPTITLASDANGDIEVVTGITSTSAANDNITVITGLGTPSTSTVLTGVKVTTQPTITLTDNNATADDRIQYLEEQGTITKTHLSASASGGAVSASGDNVTVLTGLGNPSTKNAIGADSTFTVTNPTITIASGNSGDVDVATGGATSSIVNTSWLKGIAVENETLTINAATLTTTKLGASASGSGVAWNNKDSVTAVTGYSSPTSGTVLGTSSTFNVTNPTITISNGNSGDVEVATGIGNATTKYLSASLSDTVIGADGTVDAVTSYSNPSTDDVLGADSIITVTPTTTKLKATASGANTEWNDKDSQTVLTNSTSITVTKNP